MGVDYYVCHRCDTTFPDCSSHCIWCDCGGHFCSAECANQSEDGSCCLCRSEVVRDRDLLLFLLKHYQITYEQAMELYHTHRR